MSLFTGHSRPLDKVGLAPRQYTEWNEVEGMLTLLEISHSRGCCLKFTVLLVQEGVLTKMTKYQRPQALCPGGLYSWWHFLSSANGSGSCNCAPVMWAYGVPCPVVVSPNAGPCKEDKLLYPDHHLIWCMESGFRPAQILCLWARWKYTDLPEICLKSLLKPNRNIQVTKGLED